MNPDMYKFTLGVADGSKTRSTTKTFQVSIIPPGAKSSTYHSRLTADSAEDAADQYINLPTDGHTGALVAQRDGGIVVVTTVHSPDLFKVATSPAYGHELFNVAPVTPPPPPKRARVVGRVYS